MISTRLGARIMGRTALAYVMVLAIALSMIIPGTAIASHEGPDMYHGGPSMCYDGRVHYVQPGDTLSSIARQYGTTVEALMRANGLSNPNRIYVGQKLVIPADGQGNQGCAQTHVVSRGETLSGIAMKYGVDLYELMRANNISNPNRIYAGQRLCIPYGCGQNPMPPGPGYPVPYEPPMQPSQPMQPSVPMQPSQPSQPMQPSYPMEPSQPMQPSYPMQPSQPSQPMQPSYPMQPSQPMQPSMPMQPPYPEQPMKPGQPGGPMQPPYPEQPIYRPPHDKEMDFWKGSYFKDKYFSEFVEERKDAEVRFNWYNNAPFEGMPEDRFSVRWERAIYFDGGDYRFYAKADDGVRVFVGDTMVIDGWKIQPLTEYKGDISLPRGIQWVVVEYYEEAAEAQIDVYWAPRHKR